MCTRRNPIVNVYKSTLCLILAGGLLTGSAATALADGNGHGDHSQNQQNEREIHRNQENAHHCSNPDNKERGWCVQNGYGSQYGYGNGYGNGYSNGYGNNQNAQLHGIITGVNGDQIRILQGLSTISFDATNAIQQNNTNGSLYPSRSITAYGYFDNNHYFHANSIR